MHRGRIVSILFRFQRPNVRVSLTMIVRDEQENLPRCLGSVRGLFDEIVVVDTGSKDRTVEIARSFGARVFHFTWVDDFAAARNAALQHATGEYAFWIDADDLLEPPERVKLEALLRSLSREGPAAPLWSAVRVIPGPAEAAVIPSSIISGCFRFVRASAGHTRFMSRSCRPCGGPVCGQSGPTSRSGIPVMPTALYVRESSTVTPGS